MLKKNCDNINDLGEGLCSGLFMFVVRIFNAYLSQIWLFFVIYIGESIEKDIENMLKMT